MSMTLNDDKLHYPAARRSDHVDDYSGVKVPDPYHWLEDPDSAETRAWVEAENKVTMPYLAAIPGREAIEARMKKLWNYERFTMPEQEGGRYFFTRNDGLQNQNVLYVSDSLHGEPRVLLDPNTLSKDGTVALGPITPSHDGKLLAYSIQSAGSDWQEWHVRDVDSGMDRSDLIKWSKFSDASWTKDNKGFYYSRYEEPKEKSLTAENYFQKLYYHKLGSAQSEDRLIYERPDHKDWGFSGVVSDDGRFLIINVWQGTARENRLFYKDLSKPDSTVVELLAAGDALYSFLGNKGDTFYLQTEKGAPKGKVIAIDLNHPDAKDWKTVVPEAAETLESVGLVGEKLFCNYLKDAHALVQVYDLKGKAAGEVSLPGIGSAAGFGGKISDTETFYSYTSYTVPNTIYRYDVKSGKSELFREPKVAFDPSLYETKEVFVTSKDGTKVPVFLTYKKGIKLDGSNPTLMYGYGGFSSAEVPVFSVSVLVWLEMGGVYADCVLRGGSEYGESWHQAGMKQNKQNVFDDFISIAEWLIANKYTSSSKLACFGGSNGGLLIGAMITQRPDLFGATLPAVGVMDMLRFNKFTIGWAWTSDYGDPDKPEDFAYIYKYSPLHNLKPGTHYPPTLITTADHDDRVVPAHSFKFAATMQADQAGDAPVLIRIETKAGHGGGKPVAKIIEERADMWGFLVKNLKMSLPLGFGG